MYAVIKTGGKQYRVSEGQKIKVETLDADIGQVIDLNEVLLIEKDGVVNVGTPLVENAKVQVKIINHGRGDKIRIIKFRRRKHYMRRMGHRQNYTQLLVESIQG